MEFTDCLPLSFDIQNLKPAWESYQCFAKNFPSEIQLAQTLFAFVFGFGGFVFGIWRTWRYRERYLFSRLQDALGHQAAEINDTARHILSSTIRPSIDQPGLTAFGTLWPLAQLRRSFLPILAFAATRTAAHQHLEASANSLVRTQENFAKFHALALRKALTARLLCSAVDASSAAAANGDLTRQLHTQLAHEHVMQARKLPDCNHDPDALEVEINLLLAENNYQQAAALAQKIIAPHARTFMKDDRSATERDLAVGRAHKYQALAFIANGNPALAANSLRDALKEFGKHRLHIREISLLDYAQQAELRAACAKRLGWRPEQRRNSRLAELCYIKLLIASDPWRRGVGVWIVSKLGGDKFHTYLRKGATAGMERLQRLRADPAYFPPPFPTLNQ